MDFTRGVAFRQYAEQLGHWRTKAFSIYKRRAKQAKENVFFYSLCLTMLSMTRDEIIEKLKEREADLRAQGVAHAALFGSIARGDDRRDSDIDILVDLDPAIVVTIFDYAGVKDFIADMFDRPVDVVSRESLKPRLRPKATADAIYAF
jgi:predicted nucleotidyltransferase